MTHPHEAGPFIEAPTANGAAAEATPEHVEALLQEFGEHGIDREVALRLTRQVVTCPEEGQSDQQQNYGEFMASDRGKRMGPMIVKQAVKMIERGIDAEDAFTFALGPAAATDEKGDALTVGISAELAQELESKKKSAPGY